MAECVMGVQVFIGERCKFCNADRFEPCDYEWAKKHNAEMAMQAMMSRADMRTMRKRDPNASYQS